MAIDDSTTALPSSVEPLSPAISPAPPSETTRCLTVSYTSSARSSRLDETVRIERDQRPEPVPFLRMQGHWLDRAGFTIGTKVRVRVSPECLILEVIHQTPERSLRLPRQLGQTVFSN